MYLVSVEENEVYSDVLCLSPDNHGFWVCVCEDGEFVNHFLPFKKGALYLVLTPDENQAQGSLELFSMLEYLTRCNNGKENND